MQNPRDVANLAIGCIKEGSLDKLLPIFSTVNRMQGPDELSAYSTGRNRARLGTYYFGEIGCMENHPESAWFAEKIGDFTPEDPDIPMCLFSRKVSSASLGTIIETLKTARDDPGSLEPGLPPREPSSLPPIWEVLFGKASRGNKLADVVDARMELDDEGRSTFDVKYESNHVESGAPRFLEFLEMVHEKCVKLGMDVKFYLRRTRSGF
nr:hypothetical protein [Candidatus Sigynarchaeum springense]